MDTEPVLEVWVDEDLCSGCGNCVGHAPEVFIHINGLARVIQERQVCNSNEKARIPFIMYDKVIDAAEDCPGEIIFVDGTRRQQIVPDPTIEFGTQ